MGFEPMRLESMCNHTQPSICNHHYNHSGTVPSRGSSHAFQQHCYTASRQYSTLRFPVSAVLRVFSDCAEIR